MIISAPTDYRIAAKRKLPRFLFDYLDGGANSETTLRRNISDLEQICLKQRILKSTGSVSLKTELFGETLSMPVILGPVGLNGMFARRGEVQTALAARKAGIPFTLSTVSVCSMDEVIQATAAPVWFQLYVLKDKGFMRYALERAHSLGVKTLVFTVDMPTPGSRYRDRHSGMSGPLGPFRRACQAALSPSWAIDVGIYGQPHDLGNVSAYRGRATGLVDYIAWLASNFDPSIGWRDLEWIRDYWQGTIIIKGILDPDDAKDASKFGADGIVVSNHGGRQLDGVVSTARALPEIVDVVGDRLTVLADSGIRSGLDVLRMLSLGAKGVLLGRAYMYALATSGEAGVSHLLNLFMREMEVGMTLAGETNVEKLSTQNLARFLS